MGTLIRKFKFRSCVWPISEALIGFTFVIFLSACYKTIPAPQVEPRFPGLSVSTITIKPQHILVTPSDPPNETITNLLREVGTVQLLTTLFRQRISQDIRRTHCDGGLIGPVVEAVVSMPVQIPSSMLGMNASGQKGSLATIEIFIKDGPELLAKASSNLNWNDVRWTRGAPKHRRRRASDEVLQDAMLLVIENGVYELQKQISPNSVSTRKICNETCDRL